MGRDYDLWVSHENVSYVPVINILFMYLYLFEKPKLTVQFKFTESPTRWEIRGYHGIQPSITSIFGTFLNISITSISSL